MSIATIAERYARAIFEVGMETNQVEHLVRQIREFAQTYRGSPELRSVLDNPIIEQARRDAILAEVASQVGLEGVALNTVRLLASRHKLQVLPEIANRLGVLADRNAGVLRATVTSAGALPDSYYDQLTHVLEAATQRRIVLERKQDPSLIAGVVTRIGDYTIDGSVRGRLAAISQKLQFA